MAPVTTASASSNRVLVDGYIAHCFTSQQAERYFRCLLKSDVATAGVYPASITPGIEATFFFVSSVPTHISHQSPGQSRWTLDRGVVHNGLGSVVPQTLWGPHTATDRKHYVKEAELQLPIFFQCSDGKLGLSLEAAASGRCHGLIDTHGFAPLGFKSTTHIRIVVCDVFVLWCDSRSLNPTFQWPGYVEFKRQIQIRDETSQRNPISNFRFAYHIGRSVDAFIRVKYSW
jgi:hypothetical protein